ncbi:hypothetical protein [Candidatus Poriferisodalis sp.]|uniref:hypothetical protein n=1 Tax=Candidatus Poriferisodalis sp. TaxID=3101277 RepID=UPI003B02DD83
MRAVVRLVEDVVLGLCGLVAGWIVVSYVPGRVLPAIAATVVLAVGGRLLFSGTIWTAGIGLVVAGAAGAGVYVADLVGSLGT